jgi:K+-sensing histidine kinase KdpD
MSSNLEIPTEIDLAEFIAREAHDLKSPFNRVMGFIKLVLKGMDGPISNQAQGDLTTAYQNSLYALAMMSGLVEIARLERGERTPTPADCSLDLSVQQMIVDWKRMFPKETPVEVHSTVPAVSLQVDEMLLRQCLSAWMSYVAEFVQGEGIREQETGGSGQGSGGVVVEIRGEDRGHSCEFQVRSLGKKRERPPECDLTIYGYVAQRLVALNGGYLQELAEDEQGAWVRFSFPKDLTG